MILKLAGKEEADISDEEREMMNEQVSNLAAFTGGIADLAMPGLEAIAGDIADAKTKINELQTFCERLERHQLEYQQKVAGGFLQLFDVVEGKATIHPVWRENLQKQVGP